MPKRVSAILTLPIQLDRSDPLPVHRQLEQNIRALILAGALSPGARLPSSRSLASSLGVARSTVLVALDRLLAEGYLVSHVGDGTYVATALLAVGSHPRPPQQPALAPGRHQGRLSQRGRELAGLRVTADQTGWSPRPFRTGVPAIDGRTLEIWGRLLSRAAREATVERLTYGDPAGLPELRQAIAAYLGAARGVRCDWRQIVITAGSQQALDLLSRLLLDPGDAVWVEDPGYIGARGAFSAAGAVPLPVPVDEHGLDVERGKQLRPAARLAYVTPSHQYPLGVTLSLPRRLALLAWAAESQAWIIEDDYDSEFRYAGAPLVALQNLDEGGRVIYVGTFSKVLFPALRIGYLIPPPPLVDAVISARALVDRQPSYVDQAALAELIASGHFARHVRRLRDLYADRQQALIAATDRHLGGVVTLRSHAAGMHLVGQTGPGHSDRQIASAAADAGIDLALVGDLCLAERRPGLLFGYAGYDAAALTDAASALAVAIAAGRARG